MSSKKFWIDLVERVVATFLMAFLAVFTMSDLSTARAGAVAGLAAVLSVVKGIVATKFGDKDSASLVQ